MKIGTELSQTIERTCVAGFLKKKNMSAAAWYVFYFGEQDGTAEGRATRGVIRCHEPADLEKSPWALVLAQT